MKHPVFIAALLATAYIVAIALLFRWFARAEKSHVLPITNDRPAAHRSRNPAGLLLRIALSVGAAATLLAIEVGAFAGLSYYLVPDLSCPTGWFFPPDCTLRIEPVANGNTTPEILILLICAMVLLVARRFAYESNFYPLVLIFCGMASFGAAVDLISGIDNPARPQLVFKLVTALQFTAAFGFALGLLIMKPRADSFVRGAVGHIAGACVRLLGAVAMLLVWPRLPPASAVTFLLTLLLAPGVATALSGAAALSIGEDRPE